MHETFFKFGRTPFFFSVVEGHDNPLEDDHFRPEADHFRSEADHFRREDDELRRLKVRRVLVHVLIIQVVHLIMIVHVLIILVVHLIVIVLVMVVSTTPSEHKIFN